MDIQADIAKALGNWDKAEHATGSIPCLYSETYAESLDIQGVSRSITCSYTLVQDRGIAVGDEIFWIATQTIGLVGTIGVPFHIETIEPDGAVVTMRLRDG